MFGKIKTQMEALTVPLEPETVNLEELAIAATPDAEAKLPALRKAFRADHAKDVRGYSFECRRFGDFLSVFIQRGDEKHASAIQLIKARDIQFCEGHGPDNLGEIAFQHAMQRLEADGNGISFGYSERPYGPSTAWPAPGKGFQIVVRPDLPSLGWGHSIIWVEPEPTTSNGNQASFQLGMSNSYSNIQHKIAKAPRPAADDKIVFVGAKTTLYIPAGLGRGVYDAILAELSAPVARRRK